MTRQWGNPEWTPVYCSFITAKLWSEVNRVTEAWFSRPDNIHAVLRCCLEPGPVYREIMRRGVGKPLPKL